MVLLVLGFPVAVVLAWVFDITPEHNVVRTGKADFSDQEETEPEPEPEPAPALSVEMGGSERRQVTLMHCAFEVVQSDDPEVDRTFQWFVETAEKNGVDIKKSTYTLGRPLKLDVEKEKFVGDTEADKLLTREYREPFVVPKIG